MVEISSMGQRGKIDINNARLSVLLVTQLKNAVSGGGWNQVLNPRLSLDVPCSSTQHFLSQKAQCCE
jgi:hypothetical protein